MGNDRLSILNKDNIQSRIYDVRGQQVMIDYDLARLYAIKTKRLNEQVKRNIERFPQKFMFQLLKSERDELVAKCDHLRTLKFSSSMPYVFTEQGVAMLSAVLNSSVAIQVSIQIMSAFVSMRKFIASNAQIFQRLDSVEKKQIEYQIKTNDQFSKVFKAIEDKSIVPSKGIFFDGKIFDAYRLVSKLIKGAKASIVLIDNYIDESILTLFSKTKAKVTIYTKLTKQLELDIKKYKTQYDNVQIKDFTKSHDRFLIIDNKEVYHFGASLKDLGKKWFAFSKFDKGSLKILNKLKELN